MMGNAPTPETGDGESRLQHYRKRYARVVGGLFVAGAGLGVVMGMAVGLHSDPNGLAGMTSSPLLRWLAVVCAVLFVLAGTVGTVIYFRAVDELEIEANKIAGLIGINVYAVLYMTWWPLAKMHVVPPVDGDAIFLITMTAAIAAFCWRRFR